MRRLRATDAEPLCRLLEETFPDEGFTAGLLRRRLFDDPDYLPEMFLAQEEDTRLAGMVCGVVRPASGDVAEMKWFGVLPRCRRRGIGAALFDAWEETARRLGASKARVGCSVPGYLAPGISTRHTDGIAFLWRRGYARTRDATNMEVDLRASDWSVGNAEAERLEAAGIVVRRLREEDAGRADAYMNARWAGPWHTETMLAFRNRPISGFIAERAGHIVGFAVYDVNQFGNSFGPTGVDPDVRGLGAGAALLKLCLDDLRRAGFERAVIGAVGPVPFYRRVAGARISETFWMMEKPL